MKIYIVSEINDPFSDDDGTNKEGVTEKIVSVYLSEERAKNAAKRITNGLRTRGEYRAVKVKDFADYIIAKK